VELAVLRVIGVRRVGGAGWWWGRGIWSVEVGRRKVEVMKGSESDGRRV